MAVAAVKISSTHMVTVIMDILFLSVFAQTNNDLHCTVIVDQPIIYEFLNNCKVNLNYM